MTTDHERKPSDGEAIPIDPNWDWRQVGSRGFITLPGDQGPCQSSAAFAVASAMSAWLRIKANIAIGEPDDALMPELSPGDIFYCAQGGGRGKCATSLSAEDAMAYAVRQGAVPTSVIPYTPGDQDCGRRRGGTGLRASQLSSFTTLTKIQDMEFAISSTGPVVATFQVHQDFRDYKGGIYRWDKKSPPLYLQTVCVVGCDHSKQTWICKNSRGPDWGVEGGFFYIGYGECGIDTQMWKIDGFVRTFPWGSVVGKPITCYFNGQLFIYYLGDRNEIFYQAKRGAEPWGRLQWLSHSEGAAGNLTAVVLGQEMYVGCRSGGRPTGLGTSFYPPDYWDYKKLSGPPADGDPNAVVIAGQLHFYYRDTSGNIQDIYFVDGKWGNHQMTGSGGLTKGPPAAGNPKPVVYDGGLHVLYRDAGGNIQDLFHVGSVWDVQQITGNDGKVQSPRAVGDPAPAVYSGQLHLFYRDDMNVISDAYFDPTAGWRLQNLSVSSDHKAAGDPSVTGYGNQIHVCYRDSGGNLQDAYFVGGLWAAQQLTHGGVTNAPLAASDPAAVGYGFDGGNGELHFVYRDIKSNLRDVFFDGSRWRQQPLGY